MKRNRNPSVHFDKQTELAARHVTKHKACHYFFTHPGRKSRHAVRSARSVRHVGAMRTSLDGSKKVAAAGMAVWKLLLDCIGRHLYARGDPLAFVGPTTIYWSGAAQYERLRKSD